MRLTGAALYVLVAPLMIATQTAPTQAPAPKLTSVVGCVAADETGQFSVYDDKQATTYRLTGKDLKAYVGQRVEMTGGPPKRVRVAGGLLPTPNAAAQAGAIDPPPAAAGTPGAHVVPPAPLEEFRVKNVRLVAGDC